MSIIAYAAPGYNGLSPIRVRGESQTAVPETSPTKNPVTNDSSGTSPVGSEQQHRSGGPPAAEFAGWVHDALNRLYDTVYLRSHPLAEVIHDKSEGLLRRSQMVRRELLRAIHDMRPAAGVPAHSPDWRGYRILELRYIEGLNPAKVMKELNLGRSQYFREQKRVLEALTEIMWDRWGGGQGVTTTPRESLMRSEFDRLAAEAKPDVLDPATLFDALRPVVEPLAEVEGVSISFLTLEDDELITADAMLLRHAILNALTYVLRHGLGERIEIGSYLDEQGEGILIRVLSGVPREHDPKALDDLAQERDNCLRLADDLMRAMGGRAWVTLPGSAAHRYWELRLGCPAPDRLLLVIDDNEGFAELYRRFLAGRGWRVVGVRSGREAMEAITSRVAALRPTVILLDVLMPSEDGWQFLSALGDRAKGDEHKALRDIPVIICSVLNQPELAQALGAAGYLRKPVDQARLLQALERWG